MTLAPKPKLPEFTYVVWAQSPDGDVFPVEVIHGASDQTNRDNAQDAAAQCLQNGWLFRVERTERDEAGRPMVIRDVTEDILPSPSPCDCCDGYFRTDAHWPHVDDFCTCPPTSRYQEQRREAYLAGHFA